MREPIPIQEQNVERREYEGTYSYSRAKRGTEGV
jgi:hypothetical protein